MSCDWTEKVSLLIDGELADEEARRTRTHVEVCPACRRAREDFLLLREQISSYQPAADAAASRRALEQILAGGASTRAAATRPSAPSTRERFSFFKPRLTPAFASAMAVVVVALALGLVWSFNSRDAAQRHVAETAPQGVNADDARRGAERASAAHVDKNADGNADDAAADENVARNNSAGGADKAGSGIVNAPPARERRGTRGGVRRERSAPAAEGGERAERAKFEEVARHVAPNALREFRPLFDAAGGDGGEPVVEPARFEEAPAVGEERETARHFEQAQVLLRSFRNARPESRRATIADERRRSQKLLYRNIVLRREAARSGNAPAARALDSLEPILIDIANLPDKAGSEDVRTIQERMQRKNIVAVLQANLAAAPRAY